MATQSFYWCRSDACIVTIKVGTHGILKGFYCTTLLFRLALSAVFGVENHMLLYRHNQHLTPHKFGLELHIFRRSAHQKFL